MYLYHFNSNVKFFYNNYKPIACVANKSMNQLLFKILKVTKKLERSPPPQKKKFATFFFQWDNFIHKYLDLLRTI